MAMICKTAYDVCLWETYKRKILWNRRGFAYSYFSIAEVHGVVNHQHTSTRYHTWIPLAQDVHDDHDDWSSLFKFILYTIYTIKGFVFIPPSNTYNVHLINPVSVGSLCAHQTFQANIYIFTGVCFLMIKVMHLMESWHMFLLISFMK